MRAQTYERHYEEGVTLPVGVQEVFSYADDFSKLSSHMNTSSSTMMGGSMETLLDEGAWSGHRFSRAHEGEDDGSRTAPRRGHHRASAAAPQSMGDDWKTTSSGYRQLSTRLRHFPEEPLI